MLALGGLWQSLQTGVSTVTRRDFRFRVIAANPRTPASFSHVYVVARLFGRDIAMDPTYRSNALGYEYPVRFRVGDSPA